MKTKNTTPEFADPLTLTFTGKTAAAIRFAAFVIGETPDRFGKHIVRSFLASDFANGFCMGGPNSGGIERLLAEDDEQAPTLPSAQQKTPALTGSVPQKHP